MRKCYLKKIKKTFIFRDIERATKYGPDANLEKRDLPSSMRDPVQARTKKVDLESGVGKTVSLISMKNGALFGFSKPTLATFWTYTIGSRPGRYPLFQDF